MKMRFYCHPETGEVSYTCPRCGARFVVEFPTTFEKWQAAARAFEEQHQHERGTR